MFVIGEQAATGQSKSLIHVGHAFLVGFIPARLQL
jgi:hypothetical protein